MLDLDNNQPDLAPTPLPDVLMAKKEDDWHEPFIAFLVHQLVPPVGPPVSLPSQLHRH
jgi:hypothetical protein